MSRFCGDEIIPWCEGRYDEFETPDWNVSPARREMDCRVATSRFRKGSNRFATKSKQTAWPRVMPSAQRSALSAPPRRGTPMSTEKSDRPTWLELERVLELPEVEEITRSLSTASSGITGTSS